MPSGMASSLREALGHKYKLYAAGQNLLATSLHVGNTLKGSQEDVPSCSPTAFKLGSSFRKLAIAFIVLLSSLRRAKAC